LTALAEELQIGRAVLDPLHERFLELADAEGLLTKKDLAKAIPALEQSPFFSSVFGLLRGEKAGDEAGQTPHGSQAVAKNAFIGAQRPRVVESSPPSPPIPCVSHGESRVKYTGARRGTWTRVTTPDCSDFA
jgi:hypothetical protein